MIALILATTLAAVDGPAAPKEGGPKVTVAQPDESKFPEIGIEFEVRAADGTFLRDARRDQFRVLEDGKEQAIESFDSPVTIRDRPTTVVLVVDRSGSMRPGGKMQGMRRAVGTFLDGLPDGSRVALLAFSSDVDLVCPFTTDKARVREAADGLEAVGGTRYFDAVAEALTLLEGETGRRAVLALTDGLDTESRLPIDEPIAEARRLGVPVHTLGLGRPGEIDDRSLDRLAAETRGRSYRARDAEALKAIYQELAERLGATYRLSYRTGRAQPDGTLRPIRVVYADAPSGAGETAVFIRGMVVPEAGWSRLFLLLVAALVGLALLPTALARRRPA